MKKEILQILREKQNYISGQELCETFNVSRTAIWKVIRQLVDEGYNIQAVRNKGYILLEGEEVYSKDEIERLCESLDFGHDVIFLPTIDTTNRVAKELGEKDGREGTLVVANHQSGGKGRRGKSWDSPTGENIYMSLLLRPQIPAPKASMLTLLMAYSIVEAMQLPEAKIKWPNDIVINGKKLCGILTEMSADMEGILYLTIGVGINVNQATFSKELQDKATSLLNHTGKSHHRGEIIASIMSSFEKNYKKFLETGDLAFIVEDYNHHLVHKDVAVILHESSKMKQVISKGIDQFGRLVVCAENGETETIIAGEVSVRGIYGYV